jgi:hypothetical protein
VLARSTNGRTEAMLLAHGFTTAMLTVLVRDGLATASPEIVHYGVSHDAIRPDSTRSNDGPNA